MNSQNETAHEIKDGINFIGTEVSFMLYNTRNSSYFSLNTKSMYITFRDSFGNIMQNSSIRIKFYDEAIIINTLGKSINRSNGTVIAFLSNNDVQELAEKTFYEEGQTRVYDFINLKFNIEL
ncbi:hypothetical protein [Flavobacterium sp.]|uniref:hypothetical protein n=1 Tax=Flavobacterium sp. TaxID=239 RepID=UPI00286E0615|nr:hypothetical protein [Flavobacterium sp.]